MDVPVTRDYPKLDGVDDAARKAYADG